MPHIPVSPESVGIRGLFEFRPESGGPLRRLAHALLHGESPLSRGERELIATFVSHGNRCRFCTMSHAAAARHHFGTEHGLVDEVVYQNNRGGISALLSVLLDIAERVRVGGQNVPDELVAQARALGAGDQHIHDTVLIAAAFCMYNRYVDGLRAITPMEEQAYVGMGERMATMGYAPEGNHPSR